MLWQRWEPSRAWQERTAFGPSLHHKDRLCIQNHGNTVFSLLDVVNLSLQGLQTLVHSCHTDTGTSDTCRWRCHEVRCLVSLCS